LFEIEAISSKLLVDYAFSNFILLTPTILSVNAYWLGAFYSITRSEKSFIPVLLLVLQDDCNYYCCCYFSYLL